MTALSSYIHNAYETLPSLEETLALLRLARSENVGPISFFHLLKRFGSAQEVLARLPEISQRVIIPTMDVIKYEYDTHQKEGVLLLGFFDPRYPQALRELKDAPAFLSLKGNVDLLSRIHFGIVGARNASHAGEKMAKDLAHDLGMQGHVIVSGLARGIDAAAHTGALPYGTIAVIAGGVSHIYPPENKKLYHEIAESGLIISEDPLQKAPQSSLFPKRNRLISGLSWGITIVEATLNSGSLITAKYALEQNKTIFCVPGHPLDPRARGVNRLIKQGAVLAESAHDILQDYAVTASRPKIAREDSTDAYEVNDIFTGNTSLYDSDSLRQQVRQALTWVATPIDDLAAHTAIPHIMLRSVLVDLELDGEIERYPGDCVMLASSQQNNHADTGSFSSHLSYEEGA